MKKTFIKLFLLLSSAAYMTACSGGGGSSSSPGAASTTVTLTGSLKVNGTAPASANVMSVKGYSSQSLVHALTASYKIACATFEATPKACGGDVTSTGSFSVACSGFAGIPFGCFVFNTTSYKNYSIVFNVSDDQTNAVNSGAGTATVAVNIDTETGMATADVVLPSVGAPIAAVTVADLAKMDGVYKMAPAPWAAVSTKYNTDELSILLGQVTFYRGDAHTTCPTGTTPTSANAWDPYCLWTPTTHAQGYNFATAKMSGGDDYQKFAAIVGDTYTAPSVDAGMLIYFKALTEGTTPKLTIWESQTKYNACVNSSTGAYDFKITNGTSTIPFDLKTAVTGVSDDTVSTALLTYMGTQLGTAITTFAPALNVLDAGSGSVTQINDGNVTCKIPHSLDYRFWNSNPAQLALCQADTGAPGTGTCASFKNNNESDYMNALWKYKTSLLYAAGDESGNAILKGGGICPEAGQETSWNPLCNFNFASSLAVDGPDVVKTGVVSGWTNGQPTITEVTGASEIQLGGCLQWEKDSPRPTIVPEGKFISKYDMSGNVMSEKCTWNERRLVVAGTADDYQFEVGGVKYKEVTTYIEVGGVKKQAYNKLCSISFNGETRIEQYPANLTEAQIVTNFNQRAGGRGNEADRNGMKFGILYRWIAGDGNGFSVSDSQSFYYPANAGAGYTAGSLTCANLVNGTGELSSGTSAVKWSKIGGIVGNLFDDYSASKFMSCFFVGLAKNTGSIYSTILSDWAAGNTGGFSSALTPSDANIKTLLDTVVNTPADYLDANSNNVPDKIDALRATSCMPRVQMTRVCSSNGCGDNQVICNSSTAKNGGCDDATPNGRYASMDATSVGAGRFVLFNKEERYNYQYNPSTNSGKVCTEVEAMTITNEDAITADVAAGTTLTLMFDMKSASICDGDEPKESAQPKQYMYFKKQ